jgi:iron(III) transport system ATP-binding protein
MSAAQVRPALADRPLHEPRPALEIRGLTKRFGAVPAVDDVSLTVAERELVALVGPSGCGKSTLLSLVAGILAPDAGDSGEICVGGRLVAGGGRWVEPEHRRVGVVFQDSALFPHLSVADNVAFGLPRGRGRRERVAEMLELVELRGLAGRFPHQLSGGQQQRVALARALAPSPQVVLFDEPFANLDQNLRVSVREQVVGALHAAGATGVFVTHDQAEALALGDRVAVMRAGRLEQVAEPEAAFHAPSTRFVATFLGEADFLPAHREGSAVRTEIGLCEARWTGDGPVEVMLRPHEVGLAPDPAGLGRVVAREFRGGFHLVTVRLPSGATVRSLQPHTQACRVGDPVALWLQAGHEVALLPAEP